MKKTVETRKAKELVMVRERERITEESSEERFLDKKRIVKYAIRVRIKKPRV